MSRKTSLAFALLLVACLTAPAALAAREVSIPVATTYPVLEVALPALNEKGFLAGEGEFVHQDPKDGRWIYISPTLKVDIKLYRAPADAALWYEADIHCDLEAGETLRADSYVNEKGNRQYVLPAVYAKNRRAVVAITSDFYYLRVQRRQRVGVVIRDGEILHNHAPRKGNRNETTLSMMAYMRDGSIQCFLPAEKTAEELLALGARDVFSFGPIMLQGGEVAEECTYNRTRLEPRVALGMVEPGHYMAFMVEGRLSEKTNWGVRTQQLALMMKRSGCVEAFNLDGGASSVMTFMGEQITQIGNYDGAYVKPRSVNEMIYFGVYADEDALVPAAGETENPR